MSDVAASTDSLLIFLWHSTLPGPETSSTWLSTFVVDAIERVRGAGAALLARMLRRLTDVSTSATTQVGYSARQRNRWCDLRLGLRSPLRRPSMSTLPDSFHSPTNAKGFEPTCANAVA